MPLSISSPKRQPSRNLIKTYTWRIQMRSRSMSQQSGMHRRCQPWTLLTRELFKWNYMFVFCGMVCVGIWNNVRVDMWSHESVCTCTQTVPWESACPISWFVFPVSPTTLLHRRPSKLDESTRSRCFKHMNIHFNFDGRREKLPHQLWRARGNF